MSSRAEPGQAGTTEPTGSQWCVKPVVWRDRRHRPFGSAKPGLQPGAPCKHAQRGFTLIELMVVLVLIGILSAMILPEMKGTFGDALLRSSGRELVNVFKLAYSRSVSLNQVCVVRFDQVSRKYGIESQASRRANHPELHELKDVAGSSGQLDERIRFELRKPSEEIQPETESERRGSAGEPEAKPPDTVTFYPDGTADAVEVLLRDSAGYGLRLRIDPITARVDIRELPPN